MNDILLSIISLGGIGLIFGVVLSILDSKLKVEEDPLVAQINDAFPGINCGACGFAGCLAFAKEIAKTKNIGKGCLPGGEEVNSKVANLIGADAKDTVKTKLIVLCGAHSDKKKKTYSYKGEKTCAVAHTVGGNIDCSYGCLAFGDCCKVCPVGALTVKNGLVEVDYKKCISCGKCVQVCPRNLLKLVEAEDEKLHVVACSNPEDTMSTKKVCAAGCIGCGICIKLIKDSPFYLEEKLSKIDYSKIKGRTDLELGVSKCPVKIIKVFDL